MQQQINSTQNSLDVLNQGLSEARLRNQPDFEQLKQLAIEELDRNRRKTESGGSQSPNILEIMDRTISDQVSSSANLKQYMLDHLDLDPAVRDTILKELIDQALELNSLNMQMMRRELTGQEYMAQRAKLSEDSVLSRHLSPEQQKEYRELETRQKEAVKVAAMMTRVASRSGPMSEASMDLLTQGLTAMDESQATQPDRSPLASPEKYLQDLQALESWFLGRIPEADVPGASVFFESERMSRKQARAITQQ